jgi:hypothetical protein
MCRKLETEQEKVLSCWSLSDTVPIPEQPHLTQWSAQQQQEQDGEQPSQEEHQHDEATGQQQQQQWSSRGVDELGQPVGDWDYLSRCGGVTVQRSRQPRSQA